MFNIHGNRYRLIARLITSTVHCISGAFTLEEYGEGGGSMAARSFDLSNYTHLLREVHPTVPRTEEENQRLTGL